MAGLITSLKVDKYNGAIVIISITVATLIHFPETISLFHKSHGEILFPNMDALDVVSEVTFTFISLLLLFTINGQLFHFNSPATPISWKSLFLSFIVMWVFSNLLGKSFVFLHQTFNLPAIESTVHHYLHPLRDIIMSTLVTTSSYIIHLIRRQQLITTENLGLQSENIRNQYEALKNQLNPHMLFNSLNTLRSLIREDKDRAQDYIQELSHVLRYTLQSNESLVVSLKDEMNFVSAYLFLLKMRYEDNLKFNINIDAQYENYSLPPMAVQMLIENAVKHNEISSRRPLTIDINTDKKGNLKVSNAVQPKINSNPGMGVGLANLSKRYQLIFHKEISITHDNNFIIEIPLSNKIECVH